MCASPPSLLQTESTEIVEGMSPMLNTLYELAVGRGRGECSSFRCFERTERIPTRMPSFPPSTQIANQWCIIYINPSKVR